ncbi:prolipoprotein diacylglyceryl transferase [Agaribacterium sp. ZY112]|uniref:prolipoprotein diacylglyceryl transferase n=1 Tax=Agaribacterium sp. ZY112 TaxID=3233574 RepID=UPI00352514D9
MQWNFDPVLFSIGSLSIHWYGALFAAAVLSGAHLMKRVFIKEKQDTSQLDNLLTYVVAGVVIGARLVHCLFYEPDYYLSNPLEILALWKGGLASHGGGLGAILGVFFFAKKNKMSFMSLLDRITLPTALFGVFVRSANFLNSEIVGAESELPWAIVFERVDNLARHPAQLYEALAYLCIFILLLSLYHKSKIKEYSGAMLGLFLSLCFSARFLIEFIKEPQASYSLGIGLNTGQLLSLPFLIFGIFLFVKAIKKEPNNKPVK